MLIVSAPEPTRQSLPGPVVFAFAAITASRSEQPLPFVFSSAWFVTSIGFARAGAAGRPRTSTAAAAAATRRGRDGMRAATAPRLAERDLSGPDDGRAAARVDGRRARQSLQLLALLQQLPALLRDLHAQCLLLAGADLEGLPAELDGLRLRLDGEPQRAGAARDRGGRAGELDLRALLAHLRVLREDADALERGDRLCRGLEGLVGAQRDAIWIGDHEPVVVGRA